MKILLLFKKSDIINSVCAYLTTVTIIYPNNVRRNEDYNEKFNYT